MIPFAAGFFLELEALLFRPPDEDLAPEVLFDADAVFLLPEVFGVTFFSGDFAPLVVFRVFAAFDFDPPVDRPPADDLLDDPVVLRDDEDPPPEPVLDEDPPPVVFLDEDPPPELFPDEDPPPELFLVDDPPLEVFLVDDPLVDLVDRAPEVDFRDVELPLGLAPPDLAPPDLAPPDVVFLDEVLLALDDVPFFAVDPVDPDAFFAEDPVEPDAFFVPVFVAEDFFPVDVVFDFEPAFEVDFDEVDFLAEVFDEVFFVVAIGPPVIKVLCRV